MEKIFADLLSIINFKFKSLSNYNYPVYILATIFILFVFLDTALSSKIFSFGSNYKLIIIILIKNFIQLICLVIILLKKIDQKCTFVKFKELLGFTLLTYVIVIPVMFLNLLINNIYIMYIYIFIEIFSFLVFFNGIKIFLKVNIISLSLMFILGYLILPMLFLNILTSVSMYFGIISADEVMIMGKSIDNITKDIKDTYGNNL